MGAETNEPKDKAELLDRIRQEWEALWRVVDTVSAEQMAVPDAGGWSIKDNLTHLAAWERFMRLRYLGGVPAHTAFDLEEATYRGLDENSLNEILFQRNKNLSAAEAIEMLKRSHAEVLAELERRPFSDLLAPVSPNDARPVLLWVIGNTSDHYAEHRGYMEKGIRRLNETGQAGASA